MSLNDSGGGWSDAVVGEVRKTAGCSSVVLPTAKPTTVSSTPKPTIKPTSKKPTTSGGTTKPTARTPVTRNPTDKPTVVGGRAVTIFDSSTATAGSTPSSRCTGATMNSWLSFNTFGNQNGYFTFTPAVVDASAYLLFGSCYDGRGVSSIAVDLFVGSATTLKVDVGVASACNGKTGSAWSNLISIAATGGWQTLQIPMSFFRSQDLSKMYTIGFTGGVGKEIRVRSIKLISV